MLKKNAQIFEGLFAASDLLVVSCAWTFSYWLRFASGLIAVDKGVPPFIDYLRMLLFVWLIWAFVFRRMGLYKPMRGTNRLRELLLVIRANTLAVISLLAFTYLFREKSVPFSRLVFVIFWCFATFGTVLSRTFIRGILRYMRSRGYNLRYALIVGSGTLARKIAHGVRSHPEYGVDLLGCLAADRERMQNEIALESGEQLDEDGIPVEPPKIIGCYSDLKSLIEGGGIDQVIVALPLADHGKLDSVIASVGDAMVDVRIVPDFHRFIQLGSSIEEFDGVPIVSLASTPLVGINRVVKRTADVFLGLAFALVLLPLIVTIALVVKLSSRGPIFFSQERVGLDRTNFNIYKFRTMVANAEVNGAQFATRGDKRVTPFGRFLRRTNFDELPQLYNVIRGQMSLVGPRPERPVFINEFRRYVPKYMLRHKVQAGMTGWAQVNGWRGNTSIEKRIEHDLYYIEHWSLGLDLKIIGLTLLNSFRDRNAY